MELCLLEESSQYHYFSGTEGKPEGKMTLFMIFTGKAQTFFFTQENKEENWHPVLGYCKGGEKTQHFKGSSGVANNCL